MTPEAVKVVVCACTFRRPEGLGRLLGGLAGQRFQRIAKPELLILVIDNEGDELTEAMCKEAAARGLPVRYLVERWRGISHARNRGLDAAPADAGFIAMIDDDEWPEADWLEELLLAQATTGADVVQGQVVPAFAAGTPAWIRDGGFFGYPLLGSPFRPERWNALQEIPAAATNNVLVRASAVRALRLRFDPQLGLTGGSDALFFRSLRAAGCRIVYAERAVVREDVPPARATLGYLCRRSYRNGSKRLAAKLIASGPASGSAWRLRGRLALRAGAQAGRAGLWLLVQGARGRMNRIRLAHGLVELAKSLGTIAACCGLRYEHYRNAGEAAPPRPVAAPR